jgi:hypothetical protein
LATVSTGVEEQKKSEKSFIIFDEKLLHYQPARCIIIRG